MNPYMLGTPECIAFAMGAEYALAHGNERIDPLSGEWAGDPLPNEIIFSVMSEIMGPSWDPYIGDKDGSLASIIIDAWEEGYFNG